MINSFFPTIETKQIKFFGEKWEKKGYSFNFIETHPEEKDICRLFPLREIKKLNENGIAFLIASAVYCGTGLEEIVKTIIENNKTSPSYYWIEVLLSILIQLERELGYVRVKWRIFGILALNLNDDSLETIKYLIEACLSQVPKKSSYYKILPEILKAQNLQEAKVRLGNSAYKQPESTKARNALKEIGITEGSRYFAKR